MLRASLFALSMLSAFAAPAYAAGLTASQSVEVAVVNVDETGAETVTYRLAEKVAPGDVVRYVIDYANAGAEPAANVRLNMPVPGKVELIDGSVEAGAARVSYSVDGGTTFGELTDLSIVEGESVRPASARDVTMIRWEFPREVAPGEVGKISYKAVLQ